MKRSISAEWLKLRHSGWSCNCCTSNNKYVDWKCEFLFEPRRSAKWLVQLVDSGQPVLRCFLTYFDSYLLLLYMQAGAFKPKLEYDYDLSVSVANVFLAKLIIVSILILFAQGLFMGLYWLIGTLFSLRIIPVETIEWTIRGWYASLSISALQLGLSLRIRSFATPIGISLCGVLSA